MPNKYREIDTKLLTILPLSETKPPAEPSKGGRFKARGSRGRARGKCAREESEDVVLGERMLPN